MNTLEETFSRRVVQRVSVLVVYAALIGSLAACSDSGTGADGTSIALGAAKPVSTETSSKDEIAAGVYADASNSVSVATEGFVGRVIDGNVRISWNEDPDATGYNVYRQGKYYTTVFQPEFQDTDVSVQEYSYEITAFDKSGNDTRYYAIARGLIVSVPPRSASAAYFESPTTEGFVGEVIDGGVRVSWKKDPDATGYNVYRQGKYHTTVYQTDFQDADIRFQDYDYKITAFKKSGGNTRYYTIADGLTVSVTPRSADTAYFKSPKTIGFVGEVLDGVVKVSWRKEPDATGYNVYKQGKYHTTVFQTEYRDSDVRFQDYTYRITAFKKSGDYTRYYTIATGLTVSIRMPGKMAVDITKENADALSASKPAIFDTGGTNTNGTNQVNAGTTKPDIATSDSAIKEQVIFESLKPLSKVSNSVIVSPSVPENSEINSVSADKITTESPEPIGNQKFKSVTTEGFAGEVLDNSIRIYWDVDPNASGYNVYRQAKYYTTVFTNEFNDTKVYDQDYYYEIQAFEHKEKESDTRYYYIATGLTVSARSLGKIDPDKPDTNAALLKNYELVFFDEFNGNSLDASKWNTSFLWGTDLIINNEEQYYVDILKDPEFGFNPFTFDGNNLTINTIRTPPELARKSLNQRYLSGILTSYDAFKFTYGYAEVRAKMTHGRGYWPAFWLLNAYYGGDDPEIDIMEFIGDNQDVVYHTFHYHDASGKLRSSKSEPTPGIDYTADFHTFSVEWKPGSIIYYVDGVEVHRITDHKVPQEQMYLIANTAVGGWWAGSPDKSTPFPGTYMIDYVRVYQKDTLYNDMLYDDGITSIPYADDIPNEALPNHRPTRDQWKEGYPQY